LIRGHFTGQRSVASEIGAEKAMWKKRSPGRPEGGRSNGWATAMNRCQVCFIRSAIGVAAVAAALRDARFESDRSISEVTIGLQRRFASGENEMHFRGNGDFAESNSAVGIAGTSHDFEAY
jgi:hypothetical protein